MTDTGSLLFLCVANSACSQMAEGLARKLPVARSGRGAAHLGSRADRAVALLRVRAGQPRALCGGARGSAIGRMVLNLSA